MFSVATCTSLFLVEAGYVLFLYNPAATTVQAGLMLLFAAEAGYLVKIGDAQLREKKEFGKVPIQLRLRAAAFVVPLLAVAAITFGASYPTLRLWLMVFLLFISACGKIAWYGHYRRLGVGRAP